MKRIFAALLLLASFASPSCFGQGTAFTYQGRLQNGANSAGGTYDFAFTLYATNVTGTAVAGPLTNSAVIVSNGLFTTLVDFGNPFASGSVWLEIAVRTNGGSLFTALAPRQFITSVPNAINADRAATVDGMVVDSSNEHSVALGENTSAHGAWSLAAGSGSAASGDYSTALGVVTKASGLASTALGDSTTADGYYATAMGLNTSASGFASVASGNGSTTIGGSSIAMGLNDTAGGSVSAALGLSAKATNDYTFVWADGSSVPFGSTTSNEFSICAANGVHIQTDKGIHLTSGDRPIIVRDFDVFATNAPGYKAGIGRWGLFMEPFNLVLGIPGNDLSGRNFQVGKYATDGSYTMVMQVDQSGNVTNTGNVYTGGSVYARGVLLTSDRNAKENFAPLDTTALLAKVVSLPVTEWNYKMEATEKHIGPMAQDFQSAFQLSSDDKHISVVDEGGVALAAIQGLNEKLEAKSHQLEAENKELARQLNELKALVRQSAERGK